MIFLDPIIDRSKRLTSKSRERDNAHSRPQVVLTLLMAAAGFGGMFSIFSYIAATAVDYAKMSVGRRHVNFRGTQ